jgi:nucleoside-diphosphate-sugar epimerase
MKTRRLITGGRGFIGTWLIQYLLLEIIRYRKTQKEKTVKLMAGDITKIFHNA